MTSASQPIVTVVIPCFDQGRFLSDAIESVLGQTYQALEVIVVNDGSTDETVSVARCYPGVRYIEQRNQGTAAARNAGLRDGSGEFIVFLDADDQLLPHAVATGLQSLRAHPDWAFASGHVYLRQEDGGEAAVPAHEEFVDAPYIELLRSNHIWTPGAVIYRRSVFDDVGGFDSSAGGSADYELNIRIARRFPFGCHHQVVLEYRQHRRNMSSDLGLMLRSAVTVRRWQSEHERGDAMAARAWKAGIRIVQADFGGRLIHQVKSDLRVPGRRVRALGGVLCLLRYYPAGIGRLVADGARRLFIRRVSRSQTRPRPELRRHG
jgi:glycosyltransferase involved in cell wall biosynthesis